MAYEPPYEIAVHPRFEEMPFDELPKWLQNRIEKYTDALVADDDIFDDHVVEEDVVEEAVEEDLDDSGDPMPVDVEFPHHKGGGYYILSDGTIVRGQEEAEDEQARLSD